MRDEYKDVSSPSELRYLYENSEVLGPWEKNDGKNRTDCLQASSCLCILSAILYV
jgi:hypothetical protein